MHQSKMHIILDIANCIFIVTTVNYIVILIISVDITLRPQITVLFFSEPCPRGEVFNVYIFWMNYAPCQLYTNCVLQFSNVPAYHSRPNRLISNQSK